METETNITTAATAALVTITTSSTVEIVKGAKRIWAQQSQRLAAYIDIAARERWSVFAVNRMDGSGLRVTLVRGGQRVSLFVSGAKKLAHSEVNLNTGDPTKFVRVRKVS